MALTTAGAFEGQTYAARSDDDGGSWVVDGPRFNGGGASGGSQVDHISASSNDTLFAWGGFYANNIWTRPLSAHHWRVASIGSIRRAWSRGGELFVATGYDHRPAVEYVSINNGVSWHQLPNAPP
jgi:hypothetical protein